VADTHGRPHPSLGACLRSIAPRHCLHAGDVGDLAVLRILEEVAPVTAVRGNIDGYDLPDSVTLDVRSGEHGGIKILLTHIALAEARLRADVARLARAEGADLVVCGHSHVPFAGREGDLTVFNPGSAGPRRFHLPIVLGVIDVADGAVGVRHVDCETGLAWSPR
jgi:putative phosphoesterase